VSMSGVYAKRVVDEVEEVLTVVTVV
jgi:hypothetical protein